jgi:hypothetical protein
MQQELFLIPFQIPQQHMQVELDFILMSLAPLGLDLQQDIFAGMEPILI